MGTTAESSTGKTSIPLWMVVAFLVAIALLAGTAAFYLSSRSTGDAVPEEAPAEETTAEPGSSSEADAAADQESEAAEDIKAEEPLPSFVRFAYVRAVTGSAGSWEASLDLFDIFTGAEAEAYASSHGLTVPGNGILYVNESETPESFPLSDAAVITYNTGGVEGLETHSATIQQLRDYVAGSTTAMPGAYRDQWKVTVENGVITRVEMIAVSD